MTFYVLYVQYGIRWVSIVAVEAAIAVAVTVVAAVTAVVSAVAVLTAVAAADEKLLLQL